MGERGQRRVWDCCFWTLYFFLLLRSGEHVSAQIRYSIPEENKEGSVVGHIAKDLGLDVTTLVNRRLRIVSGTEDSLFQVNENNGDLLVSKTIDREAICDGQSACLMNLKMIVDNPLEIHYVAVEITDVNDHSPSFPEKEKRLEIAENRLPGARFQLQAARDPDIGMNSVQSYKLSQNDNFELKLLERSKVKIPYLVLKKPLDRETKAEHSFCLTAYDGGTPPRSGTLNVTVTVLDINDNPPVFSQELYTVTIPENAEFGTVVLAVTATDIDKDANGELEYIMGTDLDPALFEKFDLDSVTGEIRIKGALDYEVTDLYKLDIQAIDKGQPPLNAECGVNIKILDVNDNAPVIEVTSLSTQVSEDAKPGTVISLISIIDKDSGMNGKVVCSLSGDVPFELKASVQDNMFSLVTKRSLDRESLSYYDITINAFDLGQPALSTFKTLSVQISDVNDNCPEFQQNPLELYMYENNVPGASIFSVTATDKDVDENAAISYQIARGGHSEMTSFLNINADSGAISALKSFDFEAVKMFNFCVIAKDAGHPSLSSNVTIHVFILDRNDNTPVILSPVSANGSAEGTVEIPRNANQGYLVTKVRASDADIGYNGWLLFSIQEVADHTLFGLDRYTGQIRMLRAFAETDESEHKLTVVVKDNGNVSLSATATVLVRVVEPMEAFAASDIKSSQNVEEENDMAFYLMITLGAVSILFVISLAVLIAMQCSKQADYSSKYLQDTNYDGTLCHSIQYRSGDKRYMLVGPRMSIGSNIVPGSNANTLVVPDRRSRTSVESHNESVTGQCGAEENALTVGWDLYYNMIFLL
ncbi:protocadherin alpha-13-like [Engraulis encrasicolus]|uniref:protocadherin alpha-13-like n=1 Tax=Engraulis encrasicolus TaxID=184585 RepID=UPI002FCEECEE